MILLAALGVFGACFAVLAGILSRRDRLPERCIAHVDAFIAALDHRLGDPERPVPLHLQDQISAAMSDVTAALQHGRYTLARAIAHANRHLAVDRRAVRA